MNGFNWADAAVFVIIVLCVAAAAKKGLICSIVGFGSNILSLVLSRIACPFAVKALLATPVYPALKNMVTGRLDMGSVIEGANRKIEADMINSLNIPTMLKSGLLENNNSEVYKFLDVSGIEDYIGGYIAMIIINIAVVVGLYIAFGIGLKYISRSLKMISRLPVIKTADKIGGAALGAVSGVLIIWIVMCIATLFLTNSAFAWVLEGIEASAAASKLYKMNFILNMINGIII